MRYGGDIPHDWKEGQVMPIHKKGKRSSVQNYRPISLTSVVYKMLERIMRNKILCFVCLLTTYTH